MNRRWIFAAALVAASLLVHPPGARGQTHLGQVPANLVTLRLYSGVPGGCGPDEFEFRRMLATEGDAEPLSFRVPTGYVLVVTDVEWNYSYGAPGEQALDFVIATPPFSVGASIFRTVLVFSGSGTRGESHPMTAGFVLAEGTRLCATISPGGGNLLYCVVRGYVVSSATSSVSDPSARTGMYVGQPFPNPFSSRASLDYEVEKPGMVELRVYDVAGRLVRTLVNAPQDAGRHQAVWDGKDQAGGSVSPGLYFYQLRVGGLLGTRRAVRLD
jgi:hypothetical protein